MPDLLAPYAAVSTLEAYRALREPVGTGERSWPDGSMGLLYFAGLGATEAAVLLERLPPGDLLERQNFSPTLGAFLRSAVAYPGEVELHGYCVGPDREDERVSVEGVLLYTHPELISAQETPWPEAPHPASCQCAELWRIAQHDYGMADAECPPDEYGRFRSRRRPDEHCWRLWWDSQAQSAWRRKWRRWVVGSVPPVEDELAILRAEVLRLRAETVRLNALLKLTPSEAGPPGPAQTGGLGLRGGPVSVASAPAAKVAFFGALFAARSDVYAVRWESARGDRAGWMPAVAGGWRRGMTARSATHLPLTAEVITAHLAGEIDVGLYPLLRDDSCHWLAADFDGPAAMLDALAYLKAARINGVPAALEVSRSGVGAHAWIFFTGAVSAALARRLGMGLLREAMGVRGRMSLASYDRLFPAQDVLPVGGFGNLIAAPLQGRCRRTGTTVFLDLATMEPHEDQWAYLSTVDRMTPREVSRVAGRLREPAVGVQVDRLTGTTATRIQVPVPAVVRVSIGSRVTVTGEDLTPTMASTLMHAASLRNPLFDERQRQRRSTWDVPRFLRSYDETIAGDLVLPRGMLALVESLVAEQGSRLDLTDKRTDGSPIELEFRGTLRDVQLAALRAVTAHDLGVFVAPPGAGKTVVALAAAAKAGWPTLVLVDRKTLADQWRAQITELLGVKAGQLGGGRTKRGGVVDVAMLQTLARRDDVAELTASYGLVIVDECHHVPAAAFEDVVRQIPARRWLGLTATPYRRDRLDDLIALQLGPVRHTISSEAPSTGQLPVEGVVPAPERKLVVHHTSFRYHGDADPGAPGGMAAIYRDLVANDDRLAHAVDGVAEAMSRGRHCMVLTQWTAHVDRLAAELTDREYDPIVLIGGMGARARVAALARLDPGVGDSPLLVVATGPYVGEGFDCPVLDTLFLAAPISFSGRLVQYAGRVLRPWPGKEVAEVHDYVDVGVPVLASSMAKRARGYTSLGFPDPRGLIANLPSPRI